MHVILADRQPLLRDTLCAMVRALRPFPVLHQLEGFAALMAFDGPSDQVELLLLCDALPGLDGLTGIAACRQRFPAAKLVLISSLGEPTATLAAMGAGAAAVICRSISAEALLSALQLVLAGEVYLPSQTVMALVGRSAGPTGKAAAVLSRSETQVVPLLLDGLGNKVIAQRLGILEPAVKSRLRGIYRKMGVVNRAQAVMALLADNPQANGRYLRIVATH